MARRPSKRQPKAKRATAKARQAPSKSRASKASPRPRKAKVRARRPAAKAVRQRSTRAAAPAPNPVRALAQRIVNLTIAHDDDASFALYADNVVSTEMGMPPVAGIDAIKQKFAMWRGMVSDSTWEARNVWIDGNAIIIEWIGRVTFAATGKQGEMHEIAVHEVADGKIARERFYYDRSALQP
jgi:ketosteroid isomerase-like protein